MRDKVHQAESFSIFRLWFLVLMSYFCILLIGCAQKKIALESIPVPPISAEILAQDIKFNLSTGEVSYVLPEPALVRIRIGLIEGGPLLYTLVDWEPRKAGFNIEKWSKKDASGQVDFSHLSNLMLVLNAREEGTSFPTSIRGFNKSPEFDVIFLDAEKTIEGYPIIKENSSIRIILADKDRSWLTDTGFEIVLYVDQIFLIEGEKGVSPFNYRLNIEGFNEGLHSLTVNVSAFSGEMGSKSVKFLVKKEE